MQVLAVLCGGLQACLARCTAEGATYGHGASLAEPAAKFNMCGLREWGGKAPLLSSLSHVLAAEAEGSRTASQVILTKAGFSC